MKAIIVDIKGRLAVAMKRGGEFVKVRNDGSFGIGDEIDLAKYSSVNAQALVRTASLAAIFLVVLGFGLGAYGYGRPYAYVGIDINPSVEMTVNFFDRIIEAEGINEDGKVLISNLDYMHKKLEDGVKQVLAAAVEQGYFKDPGENTVLVSLSANNPEKTGTLQKKVEDTIKSGLEESGINSEILIDEANLEEHQNARVLGLSPGKLSMMEELVREAPEYKIGDLMDMPVKDIRKEINAVRNKHKEQEKEERKEEREDRKEYERDKKREEKDRKEYERDKKREEKDRKEYEKDKKREEKDRKEYENDRKRDEKDRKEYERDIKKEKKDRKSF